VEESSTVCSSRFRRPVRKLLDTPSYILVCRHGGKYEKRCTRRWLHNVHFSHNTQGTKKKWHILQTNLYLNALIQDNTHRRFPSTKQRGCWGWSAGVCVQRAGSKLGRRPSPFPHPPTSRGCCILIRTDCLRINHTRSGIDGYKPHQIFTVREFLSSFTQRYDV